VRRDREAYDDLNTLAQKGGGVSPIVAWKGNKWGGAQLVKGMKTIDSGSFAETGLHAQKRGGKR